MNTRASVIDKVPDGMCEITKAEFFATVGKMNVHPRSDKYVTAWETPERAVKGITYPGWKNPGDRHRYFVPKGGE